jgi:hypothetical protein
MHLVVCRIVGLDRQECSCAHMKGDELVVDTGISQPLHQLGVKCSDAVGAATAPSRAANMVW